MRTLILPVLPVLLVAVAACTPTPAETARAVSASAAQQDELSKALAGLVPGKPVTCVNQVRSRGSKAYGATILYTTANGVIHRSDTAGGCEGMARGDILITSTPSTQLCRGDIARTVQPVANIPTGSCSFGDFVPYRKP